MRPIENIIKTIAEGVFHEKSVVIRNRLTALEERAGAQDKELKKRIDRIQSDLKKAGDMWTTAEDIALAYEVRAAIASMAQNHGRSIGAIVSRVLQKELVQREMR